MSSPTRLPARPIRVLAAVGLTLAALVLTGCGLRLHVGGAVRADNTMDGSVTMAVDGELAPLMQWSPQVCESTLGGMAPSGTVGSAAYNQDGFGGCTVTINGMNITDANYLITVLKGVDWATLGSVPGLGSDHLTVTRVGDTFVVDGYLNPGSALDMAGLTLDMQVSLTFPGPVTSSNGVIAGHTVTWTLVPGGDPTMKAEASAKVAVGITTATGKTVGIVIAAVLLAALVALALVLVLRHRRTKARAAAGATPTADPLWRGSDYQGWTGAPRGTYQPPAGPSTGAYQAPGMMPTGSSQAPMTVSPGPGYTPTAPGVGLGTGLADTKPLPDLWGQTPQAPDAGVSPYVGVAPGQGAAPVLPPTPAWTPAPAPAPMPPVAPAAPPGWTPGAPAAPAASPGWAPGAVPPGAHAAPPDPDGFWRPPAL